MDSSNSKKKLGDLNKIDDLRTIWAHEAYDFTEWLAKEENLEMLGGEIGVDISLLRKEASVGSFNVDILAEEKNTGEKIIIENQLESTDHDHLGKIITYASGYDANVIIWIVKNERDEHKKAIDWLNNNTNSDLNFFIVRLELWKVDDSKPAPKFQIISQPNDWAKVLRDIFGNSELTETKEMQLNFWTKFKEYTQEKTNKSKLRRRVYPRNYYDIGIGSSECHIILTVNIHDNLIGCGLYIREDQELFKHFENNKEEIEKIVGEDLNWLELPENQSSRIEAKKSVDLSDEESWDECFEWFLEKTPLFKKAFSDYINDYN